MRWSRLNQEGKIIYQQHQRFYRSSGTRHVTVSACVSETPSSHLFYKEKEKNKVVWTSLMRHLYKRVPMNKAPSRFCSREPSSVLRDAFAPSLTASFDHLRSERAPGLVI